MINHRRSARTRTWGIADMKRGKAIAPRRPDVVDPDAMVAAALDLLEESGPDGCTPAALALRTGVDGATISALFADQDRGARKPPAPQTQPGAGSAIRSGNHHRGMDYRSAKECRQRRC